MKRDVFNTVTLILILTCKGGIGFLQRLKISFVPVFGNEMSALSDEVTRLQRGAAEGYPCRDCGKVYTSHAWRVQ